MPGETFEGRRPNMKRLFLGLVLLLGTSGLLFGWRKLSPTGLQEGDIVFQTSVSAQSRAIQEATHSPYSHMGILIKTSEGLAVFEAVKTVRYTRFDRWVRRGEGWAYVVKRLKNSDRVLTPATLAKMHAVADRFSGKPYDSFFEWSDDRIYCSELVWKIYHNAVNLDIGSLSTLRDFDLSSPAVKAKLAERYHGKVPLAEKVISPEAMFRSDLLMRVK